MADTEQAQKGSKAEHQSADRDQPSLSRQLGQVRSPSHDQTNGSASISEHARTERRSQPRSPVDSLRASPVNDFHCLKSEKPRLEIPVGSDSPPRAARIAALEKAKEVSATGGFVFNCCSNVVEECLKRRIFAAKQASWPVVEKIEDGATVFLCDEDSEHLYGVFQATTPGTFNLDPMHLKGGAMGGSPYPCQVRVRVKAPYKPAQLSSFAGIRGLFQDGSTTRLNEQLTQRMVEEITEEFQRLRRKEKGISSPTKPAAKSSPERQRQSRSPLKGRRPVPGSISPQRRRPRDMSWEPAGFRPRMRSRSPPVRLRPLPDGRRLSPIPAAYDDRLRHEMRLARGFPLPRRRLSPPPPRRLRSPPMLDRRSPPPRWPRSPRRMSPMMERPRDWGPPPRLSMRLPSPERPRRLGEVVLYRERARSPPPKPMIPITSKVIDVKDDGTFTTIFLCNVPESLTPNQCVDSLDAASFRNCYDFFLFEETKGPKLGSVSINLNSRSNAVRVFQRAQEISRSWNADVLGHQRVEVKWHKYQGIAELRSVYDKYADYLPGCPGDYNLPAHKPVFFELLPPVSNPRRGGPSGQRAQSPVARDPPAEQPPPLQLPVAQPSLPLQTSMSAASGQDSGTILSALRGAGGSLGALGGPAGGLPQEVLALLPRETQVQVLQAYQTAAQAQALQQAFAGGLPGSLPLAQLLQAQLLQVQGGQQLSLGSQKVPSGVQLPVGQARAGGGPSDAQTEVDRKQSKSPRQQPALVKSSAREDMRERGEKRKQPLVHSQLQEDIARRLTSAMGDKRLKPEPREESRVEHRGRSPAKEDQRRGHAAEAEPHERRSESRHEKTAKRDKESRERRERSERREKGDKHEKRDKKSKEKPSKHGREDRGRHKRKSREPDGRPARQEEGGGEPAVAQEDQQRAAGRPPACDAAVEITGRAQDKAPEDNPALCISKEAEDFLRTLENLGVAPPQELGADFLALE